MNEPEVFVRADETLNRVISQIRDDQWDMEMPANFVMRNSDHVPTLREIVNYHAYDDSWVPDDLVQGIWDEVGPHAEEWRGLGVFPAAVPVPADASLQDRLLGLTGRKPDKLS